MVVAFNLPVYILLLLCKGEVTYSDSQIIILNE